MTIKNQPTNFNFARTTNFRVVFDRLPHVVYYCQGAPLPGMTIGEARQATPLLDFPHPGDKIEFAPWSIRYKVDEDLENFIELSNWMQGIGAPVNNEQYVEYVKGRQWPYAEREILSDATLMILSNAKNPILQVNFKDCWPTSIEELDLNSVTGDEIEIEGSATFRYSRYEIKRL